MVALLIVYMLLFVFASSALIDRSSLYGRGKLKPFVFLILSTAFYSKSLLYYLFNICAKINVLFSHQFKEGLRRPSFANVLQICYQAKYF